MPTSIWKPISDVIELIKNKNPNSVLDIGIGFGKWGFLCREYLDIYGNSRYKKEDWKVKIEGVEIFSPYLNPSNSYVYDKIYIGNIVELIDQLDNYDLIIMGDVLEHISKTEGRALLSKICDKTKFFILIVPCGNFLYEWKGENKYESHISVWTSKDLVPPMKLYKTYPFLSSNKQKSLLNGVFIYESRS